MENSIEDRAVAWSEQHRDIYVCNADVIAELSYKQGATEQKQIDDVRLNMIVSQWKKEESLWIERYESIRSSLVERQGEYVSLELITDIFGDVAQYIEEKIAQATPKLKDGELEHILDSFNE